MTEEKQEGQKTVVSFIVGLLIGGLLVWAFSGPTSEAPNSQNVNEVEENTEDESENEEETESDEIEEENTTSQNTTTPATSVERPTLQVGEGDIRLASEQPVGTSIPLESATYPVKEGWIGVRSYEGEKLGALLGVVRFSEEQGLIPNNIILQHPTTSGREYAIVIYSESGDRKFNLADDVQIDQIFGTFTAK